MLFKVGLLELGNSPKNNKKDIKDKLVKNVFIFKENYKHLTSYLIDNVWNRLTMPSVLDEKIQQNVFEKYKGQFEDIIEVEEEQLLSSAVDTVKPTEEHKHEAFHLPLQSNQFLSNITNLNKQDDNLNRDIIGLTSPNRMRKSPVIGLAKENLAFESKLKQCVKLLETVNFKKTKHTSNNKENKLSTINKSKPSKKGDKNPSCKKKQKKKKNSKLGKGKGLSQSTRSLKKKKKEEIQKEIICEPLLNTQKGFFAKTSSTKFISSIRDWKYEKDLQQKSNFRASNRSAGKKYELDGLFNIKNEILNNKTGKSGFKRKLSLNQL